MFPDYKIGENIDCTHRKCEWQSLILKQQKIRARQSFDNIIGEFDPGSGRTLAACLTHASRTGLMKACF